MGYLDTAKGQTQRQEAPLPALDASEIESGHGYAINDINAKSRAAATAAGHAKNALGAKSAEVPALDAGPGSPSLRHRVLQLGEEHGYPALSLGQYRVRQRTVNVGLFAGKGWWQHQLNYFGDGLLTEAIRRLNGEAAS